MSAFFFKALLISTVSFFVTLYLVPLFYKIAFKWKILDVPDGNLKTHRLPTPYLGGVSLWLGFLVATSLVLPFENQLFLYIIASTLLLFVGLLDDLISLTPAQKIVGQFIATLCYLKAGFYLKISFFSSSWNIFISAFWFLLIINAFNLIDVMDGLATFVALITSLIFLLYSLFLGQNNLSLLLLSFIGSLLAFLLFNKPPAKIYLGDAGSLFIGGVIASIPFSLSWSEYNSFGFIIPLILCAIPLIEIGTLICVRTYKRYPFFLGSPDHFSIYLQERGWSKVAILFYCFIVTVALGICSFLFFLSCINVAAFFSVGFLLLFTWFFLLLA